MTDMLNKSWFFWKCITYFNAVTFITCLLCMQVKMVGTQSYYCTFFFFLKGYQILLKWRCPEFVKMEGSEKFPPCSTSKRPLKSQQCQVIPERQSLLQTGESHGLQLLTALRSFRERSLMFDFTIIVAGHAFPCHRCVLAACSDFFR